MRIAYAGAEGAFAHAACLSLGNGNLPIAKPDFTSVIAAVAEGETELGMLPLRNLRAGHVPGVAELLSEADVVVIREVELPIRMHLLGLPTADISTLESVKSHPVALQQCAVTISQLGLPTCAVSNTATAARDLRDNKIGVLASEAAARIYGLKILLKDVHDDPRNATTFAVIERRRHSLE